MTKEINKTKVKSFLTGGMLALTGAALLGGVAAYASSEDVQDSIKSTFNRRGDRGQQMNQKIKDSDIFQSIIDEDYSAFKQAIEGTPAESHFSAIENESDFDKLVDMHKAIKDGNVETANQIREDLGLEQRPERMDRDDMKLQNEDIMTAMDNADYQAWQDAVSESPRGEELLEAIDSQDKFDKLVQAHNLRAEGVENLEEAKQIREDLGLKAPVKKGGQFNRR